LLGAKLELKSRKAVGGIQNYGTYAGVDLPRQKHINIALTYIYGIGHPRAGAILDEAKVDP